MVKFYNPIPGGSTATNTIKQSSIITNLTAKKSIARESPKANFLKGENTDTNHASQNQLAHNGSREALVDN